MCWGTSVHSCVCGRRDRRRRRRARGGGMFRRRGSGLSSGGGGCTWLRFWRRGCEIEVPRSGKQQQTPVQPWDFSFCHASEPHADLFHFLFPVFRGRHAETASTPSRASSSSPHPTSKRSCSTSFVAMYLLSSTLSARFRAPVHHVPNLYCCSDCAAAMPCSQHRLDARSHWRNSTGLRQVFLDQGLKKKASKIGI